MEKETIINKKHKICIFFYKYKLNGLNQTFPDKKDKGNENNNSRR